MEEAVEEFRTAVRLEPFSIITNVRLATALGIARRWEEAEAQARRALELEPTFFQGHSELGIALLGLGRCDEAVRALQQAPKNLVLPRGILGYGYAKCGQRDRALAEAQYLEEEAKAGRYNSHFSLSYVHAGLGDRDKAFAELALALEERAWPMFYLRSNPFFDDLRSDPRFEQIVKQVGPLSGLRSPLQ